MPAAEVVWPGVETLIPHRPPMLLVERIVAADEGRVVCRGLVPQDSPFAGRGAASPFFAIELAAQTAAVLEALKRFGEERATPQIGYLASIREARLSVPEIAAGRPLLAAARHRGGLAPLAVYEVEVSREEDGGEVLTATLSTYLLPAGRQGS